jgi:hypothetical protein
LSIDVAYDIPRPEGYDVVLTDYRQNPGAAGYDFSAYAIVPYDDLYADFYFENYQGVLYANVRDDTDIQDMGPTASLLEIGVAPADGWSDTHDARLIVGHTYVVWTWDDHYAKFRVTSLSPGRVVFDWAYQLRPSRAEPDALVLYCRAQGRGSVKRGGHGLSMEESGADRRWQWWWDGRHPPPSFIC